MNLPMAPSGATTAPLQLYDVAQLQAEVRALAAERDAVILAHNYQLPEIQDVADYVGDSLGLSRRAEASEAAVIAWMRHRTTAYDHMLVPRVKGKHREVRRMLARQSNRLLDTYRAGRIVDPAACPLQRALETTTAR